MMGGLLRAEDPKGGERPDVTSRRPFRERSGVAGHVLKAVRTYLYSATADFISASSGQYGPTSQRR